MTQRQPHVCTLEASGHLIDSGLMSRYLELVLEGGATYQITGMELGRTPTNESRMELTVTAPDAASLNQIVDNLMAHGCSPRGEAPVLLAVSEKDRTVPGDFYSTTNHPTQVLVDGSWLPVSNQRMDACIVLREDGAHCVKLRDVRQGDRVVIQHDGIRVHPPTSRDARMDFAFMDNEVSSERAVDRVVASLAAEMKALRARGGRIVVVCGPVVVHTGGAPPLSRLIRDGYVQALLSGNALGVHDAELALYGTSLGVDLAAGRPVQEGHKHHMQAINAINKAGSLPAAVASGLLESGIFFEAVRAGIPYCLAGSIRDDGPLPDTVNDMLAAQEQYGELIAGADLCLMLSSMLHAIGTGNMLPSTCRTVCVDINPAVVTKLADRGSSQAFGVVTDVGLFLSHLDHHLQENGQ